MKLLSLDLSYAMGRTVTLCLRRCLRPVRHGRAIDYRFTLAGNRRPVWRCSMLSSLSASLHPGALIMFMLAALAANIIVVRPRAPWWS